MPLLPSVWKARRRPGGGGGANRRISSAYVSGRSFFRFRNIADALAERRRLEYTSVAQRGEGLESGYILDVSD